MLDFIEEWPETLALFNGQGSRPLAYVIRDVIVHLNQLKILPSENRIRLTEACVTRSKQDHLAKHMPTE
jgi:hypothetical protein